MPNFNTHRLINYTFLLGGLVVVMEVDLQIDFLTLTGYTLSYTIGNLLILIGFIIGYVVGTELITPDLDITSKAYNNWGFLKIFWLPYKLIANHGGSSHTIEGALLRMLYILLVLVGFYVVCSYLLVGAVSWVLMEAVLNSVLSMEVLVLALFYVVIGIVGANVVHVVLDKVV